MIRGRRAHGAALATLPTCAHLSPDSQQGYTELALCLVNPKPLKMSAYGTFSSTARPPRVLPTPWALPTPAFATWQGCRKTSCTLTTERCRLQPVKAKPLRGCFASLDRFPAPSASVSFATPTEMERGQGRRSRAFYP